MNWGHTPQRFYEVKRDESSVDSPPVGCFAGFCVAEAARLRDEPRGQNWMAGLLRTNRELSIGYGLMRGLRTVFFTADAEDKRALKERINRALVDSRRIAQAAGLESLGLLGSAEVIDGPESFADVISGCGRIEFNHWTSWFQLRALELPDLRKARLRPGYVDTADSIEAGTRLADTLHRFSSKVVYADLLARFPERVLPAVPSVVISCGHDIGRNSRFRHDNPEVRSVLGDWSTTPARLVAKGDSGGGVGMQWIPSSKYGRWYRGLPKGESRRLLQAEVSTDADTELPSRVGVNMNLREDGTVELTGIAQQLYRDRDRSVWGASYYDSSAESRILDSIGREALATHSGVLWEAGLRGPIGIDLILDPIRRKYLDLLDLNTRVTGSGGLWCFRDRLASAGLEVQSLGTLKIRTNEAGPDATEVDSALHDARLRLSRVRGRGAFVMPSLTSDCAGRVFTVNQSAAEIQAVASLCGRLSANPVEQLYG